MRGRGRTEITTGQVKARKQKLRTRLRASGGSTENGSQKEKTIILCRNVHHDIMNFKYILRNFKV